MINESDKPMRVNTLSKSEARKPRAGRSHIGDGDASAEYRARCLEAHNEAKRLLDMLTPPEIRDHLKKLEGRGDADLELLRAALNRQSRERKMAAHKEQLRRQQAIADARARRRRGA